MAQEDLTRSTHGITEEVLRNVLYGYMVGCNTHFLDHETTFDEPVRLGWSLLPNYPRNIGVFSTNWIDSNTELGSFPGKLLSFDKLNLKIHNPWMWEVFADNGMLTHYMDASDETIRKWQRFVQCARHYNEQNIEMFQRGHILYYKSIKTIAPNEELYVWYSASHPTYMGFPESIHTSNFGCRQDFVLSCRWKCVICSRGFNSRSNLRSHMRIHTMEKPFVCRYCKRSFSQSSTLRNHVRLHTGERPYKCHVCHSSYSQLAGLRAHEKSSRHRPISNRVYPTSSQLQPQPTSITNVLKDGKF